MTQELVSSSRMINRLDILVDDDVAEDEIEIDYFLPRNRHRFTVKLKARDVLPELFKGEE